MSVNDLKLIMGDFNVKIGKDEHLKMFTGIHSLHKESSNSGIRLVVFAKSSNMIIGNKTFKHKNMKLPLVASLNKIDHVQIDLKYESSFLNEHTL